MKRLTHKNKITFTITSGFYTYNVKKGIATVSDEAADFAWHQHDHLGFEAISDNTSPKEELDGSESNES
jgi:hypothetical protein